jgi:zinc transporter ZupT
MKKNFEKIGLHTLKIICQVVQFACALGIGALFAFMIRDGFSAIYPACVVVAAAAIVFAALTENDVNDYIKEI